MNERILLLLPHLFASNLFASNKDAFAVVWLRLAPSSDDSSKMSKDLLIGSAQNEFCRRGYLAFDTRRQLKPDRSRIPEAQH